MVTELDLKRIASQTIPLAANLSMTELAESLRRQLCLVEAEVFADLGGWEIDTQFFEAMGSSFLLAHGLGNPVADAVTQTALPRPGGYRVYARTRDWVVYPSNFQPPAGGVRPGAFQLLVDGQPLPEILGADGNGAWHWQTAGQVQVGHDPVTLALHDCMGFEARCDALLFVHSEAADFRPPDGGPELAELRATLLGWDKEPEEAGTFDLVVAGGGFAGVCAALTAARHGMKVALIQDRPVYGGPGSSEIRVSPIRHLRRPPFPRNGDVMVELYGKGSVKAYTDLSATDEMRLRIVETQSNLTSFRQMSVIDVEMSGSEISAVIVQEIRTGRRLRIAGQLFADCTGDSLVGLKAGAEYRMGRESRSEFDEPFAPAEADSILLGNSLYWWAADEQEDFAFPETSWALPIESEAHFEVPRPKWPQPAKEGVAYAAGWNWEAGWRLDNILEGERIRDHLLRAAYGTWSFLKNRSPERDRWGKTRLAWVGHVLGKRESRRLIGDYLLNQRHILDHQVERDGCATATWYFDLHFPHPENSRFFPGEEFRSVAFDDPQWQRWSHVAPGWYQEIQPFPIPYRCLYSKNVANLFMAGRNISVTHCGLAPVRTMMCTAQMGTVVGRAAALCQRKECQPRDIYELHLDALLQLLADPGLPPLNEEDLARAAKAESA
jgi:hypothetical protein